MAAEDRNKMSISLTCKDMEKSLGFYRDKLGFELKERWPDEGTPMWCNLLLGGQSVMLGAAMDPKDAASMCGDDPASGAVLKKLAERFQKSPAGVGVNLNLQVEDVDAFAKETAKRGIQALLPPRTQFYGIRELLLEDPDGYALTFFHPVSMESCQSCGMPLADAKPGQMFCHYCTDAQGNLKPYEEVFEGTVAGYFMGMQKMARKPAETAARKHLAEMPAWKMRK